MSIELLVVLPQSRTPAVEKMNIEISKAVFKSLQTKELDKALFESMYCI